MPVTTISPAITLSRTPLMAIWERVIDSLRAAANAVAHWRRDALARRLEWRRWQAVRHLSEHMLKDIGADGRFRAHIEARRGHDAWDWRTLERGGHEHF